MGEVTVLWIVMLIIAVASFAPLGIFIYRFTNKANDPLGNQGPVHHPDPKIEALIDGVLGRIFEKLPNFAPTGMRKSFAPKAPASHAAAPVAHEAKQQVAEQAAVKTEAAVQPAAKPAAAKPVAKTAAKKPRKSPAKTKA